jgi:CheY-like chemotaxis protein
MAELILIVDDDPVQRRLLDAMARRFGYEVMTADGGDAAVAILAGPDGGRVDAVILDLVMPRMDGRSVKRSFAASDKMRDVPVILITGHVAPDIDPGDFACILHKPIGIDALVQAVRACLEKAGFP